MGRLIWVGHRESELLGIDYMFSYSVTTWGSNKGKNISYCNPINRTFTQKERNTFLIKTLNDLILYPDDKVMFYSQQLSHKLVQLCPFLKNHVICLNSKETLDILNNKIHLRLWMNDKTNIPNYVTCHGSEFSYSYMKKLFPTNDKFVVQEAVSSGGNGTYLCTINNMPQISSKLSDDKMYLASPYIENSVSVNLHLLIGPTNIILFPGSVQIIENIEDKMVYRGADFIAYNHLSDTQKNNIKIEAQKIALHIKALGFEGICGIDFLVTHNEIYFMEINPRYQASSSILNLGLIQNHLPSLQELELQLYTNAFIQNDLTFETIQIDYSMYRYYEDKNLPIEYYNDRINIAKSSCIVERILYDGYMGSCNGKNDYLFSVVLKRHIVGITPYYSVFIHPNIYEDGFVQSIFQGKMHEESMIKIKIALLNQGIRIADSAKQFIKKSGGYNESTFSSIDLIIEGRLHINVPVALQMGTLSPFLLMESENKLLISYHGTLICKVDFESKKSISNKITSRGIPYKKIAFINGDRLRLKTENACYYKVTKQGCRFCPNQNDPSLKNTPEILFEDIKEVFDYCLAHESFRHIMIGGGCSNPLSEVDKILPVVKYIRSICNKEIYIMSTPPKDIKQLKNYIELGVNEFAFNIELFDRSLATTIMPAKGKIPLKHYFDMLTYAAEFLPRGAVRSMLLLGLEPPHKTIEGIEFLCKNGIQPMLSIFRPVDNCLLNYMVPPSNQDIYFTYVEALSICKKYGMQLGPSCNICKNNTLALPQT